MAKDPEPDIHGRDLFGAVVTKRGKGKLAQSFILPPFTVLNAREGWWQDRKQAWIGLGIQSELGRGGNLQGLSDETEQYRRGAGKYAKKKAEDRAAPGGSARPACDYSGGQRGTGSGKPIGPARPTYVRTASLKGGLAYGMTFNAYEDGADRARLVTAEQEREASALIPRDDGRLLHEVNASNSGTSIFDPVICELAYRWFCPLGGVVLDPFAGGSVRGIVAGKLGRRYWGCDLRAEQVAANTEQGRAILGDGRKMVRWVCGDSAEQVPAAPRADFVFSCPPYHDLEQYSDDPRDLSNMDFRAFIRAYEDIIAKACERLRENRFAMFVVGDVRDKRGVYRNFPGLTIRAFQRAGLELYNEAILITAVGSLSIRTPKQWVRSRKFGKTHQNLYVFVKGDPFEAAARVEL